jgi:nucleoside-diphosphate-sugar epimerase
MTVVNDGRQSCALGSAISVEGFRRGLWATPKPARESRRGLGLRQCGDLRPSHDIYGDGSATRDYLYVDDVVTAFLCAADSGYRNRGARTGQP